MLKAHYLEGQGKDSIIFIGVFECITLLKEEKHILLLVIIEHVFVLNFSFDLIKTGFIKQF